MLRKLFISVLCLVATISASQAQTIPNNEIWYTTTDGKIAELAIGCEPMVENGSDFKIISHTYVNGKGVIRANKAIKVYGYEDYDGIGFQIFGNIKSVTLPKDLTTIKECAFATWSNLTSITIPDSVTTIGEGAFRECSSLTSVTIPDSVTTIGDMAFDGCSSLTSVTIPDSVTTIGEGAFSGCSSLREFNGKYASEDGRCLIIDGTLNSFASAGLTEYTIPKIVTTIGYSAFSGCRSLTSVTIPDSVTTIEHSAFSGCRSLTSVTIPDSVTTIGYMAFDGCGSLTSVTIPDSVTTIGDYAFSGCSSLTSVTIGDSVTTIGYRAFGYCSSLTSITIPDSVTSIVEDAFDGCNIQSVTIDMVTGDVSYIKEIFGADKITEYTSKYFSADRCCLIKDGALIKFLATERNEYSIPNSVTSIGDGAFSGCSNLTSITIPDSVTKIGEDAFDGCNIQSVTIDMVTGDVSYIKEIFGADKITEYTSKYFSADRCCLIKDGALIKFLATERNEYSIPNSVTSIGDGAFSGCSNLTSITIPDSVTTIGNWAFSVCSSLTSVTIGDSVTTIGNWTFSGCSSLTSVTIGDSVTTIGNWTFSGCSSLTSVTIGDSVTTIGNRAFYRCGNLTSITIPDSVTSIGKGAFDECNIQSVTIDAVAGDVSYIKEIFGVNKIAGYIGKCASADGLCIIKDGTLLDFLYKGQSEYSIPNSVTSIGDGVFSGCSNLRSITIPDSVTSIGEGAFGGCNIQSITIDAVAGDVSYIKEIFGANKIAGYIGKCASADGLCIIKDGTLLDFLYKGQSEYSIPNGVITIGKEMFKGCNNLTTITIPDSVAEIGDGAFSGCSSLTEVVCLASTPPAIDDICVSEIMLIYVPKEYVKVYKKDPKWSIYKKQIKPIK